MKRIKGILIFGMVMFAHSTLPANIEARINPASAEQKKEEKKSGLFSSFKSGLSSLGSKIKDGAKAAGSKIKAGAEVAGSRIKDRAASLKETAVNAKDCSSGKGEDAGAELYKMVSSGAQLTDASVEVAHMAAKGGKAKPASKSAPALQILEKCATDKNPHYLEGVLGGAMKGFDKDAQAAIKAGKPANFKKAANNLLKVIKFLFVQSKHFSPIYKKEAHKAVFDKDVDKLVQTLLHAEYALAKSQSAQKEVMKSYTSIVAELKKDGIAGLTPIAAPSPQKAAGVLNKLKSGLATAGSKISGAAHAAKEKVASGAKAVKGKLTHKKNKDEAAANKKDGGALDKLKSGLATAGSKISGAAHAAKEKVASGAKAVKSKITHEKNKDEAAANKKEGGALDKLKSGLATAGSKISGAAHAAEAKVAGAAKAVKDKLTHNAPADDAGDAPADDADQNATPSDEAGDAEANPEADPEADQNATTADDAGDAPADDAGDAPADEADQDATTADDAGDAPADDAGDADQDATTADDAGDAPADDAGDAEANPEADPDANPEADPEANPEANPEADPEADPDANPDANPDAADEEQPADDAVEQ